MGSKEGFCESCQQNKDHRRVAGVFSLINLMLLGIPSLFGISTWQCVHCRSRRVFLVRSRKVSKKIPASSFRRVLPQPPPNGRLKTAVEAPVKAKSTRSRLYSTKYRDGVVKRIVSGITSITEVKESLQLPESDVVDWIKQSFQRKEDRVEMLREALMLYQKANPDFNVERVIRDVEATESAKVKTDVVESQRFNSDAVKTTGNRLESVAESFIPNQG